ncbi:MAG: hypothetical protein IH840_08360 [Candidatus Heimdallarchaeota archaeon]|nr:hypothetical protein [Candidatus Heimdallarchaeota archaeon]
MILPTVKTVSKSIDIGDGAFELVLVGHKFDNGLIVYLYDDTPRLGSVSAGMPLGEISERYTLFQGKQGEISDTVSLTMSKKTGALVYCFVNISKPELTKPEIIRSLIDEYFQKSSVD